LGSRALFGAHDHERHPDDPADAALSVESRLERDEARKPVFRLDQHAKLVGLAAAVGHAPPGHGLGPPAHAQRAREIAHETPRERHAIAREIARTPGEEHRHERSPAERHEQGSKRRMGELGERLRRRDREQHRERQHPGDASRVEPGSRPSLTARRKSLVVA